jgi:hypothetical protein
LGFFGLVRRTRGCDGLRARERARLRVRGRGWLRKREARHVGESVVGVLQERVLARAVFDVPGGLGLAGSADLWRVRLGLPVRTLCLLAPFDLSPWEMTVFSVWVREGVTGRGPD